MWVEGEERGREDSAMRRLDCLFSSTDKLVAFDVVANVQSVEFWVIFSLDCTINLKQRTQHWFADSTGKQRRFREQYKRRSNGL